MPIRFRLIKTQINIDISNLPTALVDLSSQRNTKPYSFSLLCSTRARRRSYSFRWSTLVSGLKQAIYKLWNNSNLIYIKKGWGGSNSWLYIPIGKEKASLGGPVNIFYHNQWQLRGTAHVFPNQTRHNLHSHRLKKEGLVWKVVESTV